MKNLHFSYSFKLKARSSSTTFLKAVALVYYLPGATSWKANMIF